MIKKQKEVYTSPTTAALVVKFEGGILSNSLDAQGYSTQRGGVPTLGDDEDNGSF